MGFDTQPNLTYRFYLSSLVQFQSLDFEKSPVQIVDWCERLFAQLLVSTKGANGSL